MSGKTESGPSVEERAGKEPQIECPYCKSLIYQDSNFCPRCRKKVRKVCNCWVKKKPYDCGMDECPGYRLFWMEKHSQCRGKRKDNDVMKSVGIHVDCTELEQAIEKSKQLFEALKKVQQIANPLFDELQKHESHIHELKGLQTPPDDSCIQIECPHCKGPIFVSKKLSAGQPEKGQSMNNKRITPEPGKFYILKTHNATIKLLCLSSQNGDAFFQNIVTGWTFTAHGVYQYDDGEIGWDYSTNEHFENVATIEFF